MTVNVPLLMFQPPTPVLFPERLIVLPATIAAAIELFVDPVAA